MHPLGKALVEAIDGRFPAPDGGWSRVPLWKSGVEGSVSMTGRAYVAVGDDVPDAVLDRLGVNGLGGASNARTTAALAAGGYIECLDMLLGCRVVADEEVEPLVERPDLTAHPRAGLAQQLRSQVRVLGHPVGEDVVVTLGEGIGGLTEFGIEVVGGGGRGAVAVRAALATLDPGTPVLAACSPGNVRAVRTFTAAGFRHVGEVALWCPERGSGDLLPGP